jgi:hypothetical protein
MCTANDTYWPSGWSRERLIHATSQDLTALGDNEKDRMFDSLRSTLGKDKFQALLAEMSLNYRARLAAERAANPSGIPSISDISPEDQAPFLRALRIHFPGAQPWGFVVFRTCCYDDEDGWQLFRSCWNSVIASTFQDMLHLEPVANAQQRFTVHWVEDPKLESADVHEVAKQYRVLLAEPGAILEGLTHSICLAINKASLQSMFEPKVPTPSPWSAENIIPFAIAVDRWAGEDREVDRIDSAEHGFSTSFKVAVATVPTCLFETIVEEIQTPREMSVGLRENKVWFSGAGRHGFFTIKT